MLYVPLSQCTFEAQGPFKGGSLDFSIAETSYSFVESSIVSNAVLLLPRLGDSTEESLWDTSEAYSSSERSIEMNVTVFLFFLIRF